MFSQQANKKSAPTGEKEPAPNRSTVETKDAPEPNTLWQNLALRLGESGPASAPGASVAGGSAVSNVEGANGARFHTDPNAASAAEHLNASAFTIGRDVFFGPHQFAPGTPSGDKLIRHELAHVAQAGNSTIGPEQSLQMAPHY